MVCEFVVSLQVVYSIISRFISMIMCKLVVCLTARFCSIVDVVCLIEISNMISVKLSRFNMVDAHCLQRR